MNDLVKAELLADVSAIRPGEAFTLGVMLDIRDGWHIYWKDPGAGGVPTEVDLTLPEGFTVGEVRYPVPMRFSQPGDIVGYGYKGQVMLLVEVTPPAELEPGTEVELIAEPAWLSCDPRVCVPGEATLRLRLPVAEEVTPAPAPAPANRELFDTWGARLPRHADKSAHVEQIQARSLIAPGGSQDAVTLTMQWQMPVSDVEFFPVLPNELAVERVAIAKLSPVRTEIRFTARLMAGLEPFERPLEVLVAFNDEQGQRHGVMAEVPLRLVRGR